MPDSKGEGSDSKAHEDTIDIVVTDSPSKSSDTMTVTSYENEEDNLAEQDIAPLTIVLYDIDEMTRLFRALKLLSPVQIRAIELRYLNLLRTYQSRLRYIDFIHHFTRSFISLGSVAVPALLSIQSPTSSSSVGLYWTTWMISLMVTCFHNFVTLFRFDKKHYGLHTTFEKLQSEGWAYLQLTGRYTGHNHHNHTHIHPTHKNQYNLFVNTIEKMQLKQISEEYNGALEERPNAGSNPLIADKSVANNLLSPIDSTVTPLANKK
jgi:hypothetical protein